MSDDAARDDVAREVAAQFLSGRSIARTKKHARMKPNRCLGCGKPSRHIFCSATYAACQELYRERKASS